MKKQIYILICLMLGCLILAVIGYNQYSIDLENKKLQDLKSETTDQPTSDIPSTTNQITINCIGDDLTLGSTKTSYPSSLTSLTGYSTNKFGGAKDQTIDLSIRIGKTKVYAKNVTIPADVTSIPIKLYDSKEKELDVLKSSGSNFSTVEIDGIAGKLSYDSSSKQHTFTRTQKGDEKNITSLTQITAQFPEFNTNDIAVIFTGTYDPYYQDSIFKTMTYQGEIISHLKTTKYIVVSLTSKRTFSIVDDMNKVLKEKYGDHYLDFRTYLLKNGLQDAGITPTDQDKKDIANGYIPTSLLNSDKITGNEKFNSLLTKQIIQKMKDLKYID